MHTILFPYFSEEEVDRYERILEHMLALGKQDCEFEFVLASSPRRKPSPRLLEAAQRVAPARFFECPSKVFGYPAGATAMFWDCMWHVANDRNSNPSKDFVLWMESDMCPIKEDWMDRLDAQWNQCGDALAMGISIPDVYYEKRERFRFKHLLRPRKSEQIKWISAHINGGACYRRDLVRYVGPEYREGIFDMELGQMFQDYGGYASSPAFAFSSVERVASDLDDPNKVVLHGYLQDKDYFLDACIDGQPRQSLPKTTKHPSEPMLDAILKVKEKEPQVLRVVPRTRQAEVVAGESNQRRAA